MQIVMARAMCATIVQLFVIRNNLMQTVMGLGMCVIQHQGVEDVDNRSVSNSVNLKTQLKFLRQGQQWPCLFFINM